MAPTRLLAAILNAGDPAGRNDRRGMGIWLADLRPLLFRCGNLCLPLDILMLIPPTGTVLQDARPDTLMVFRRAYPIARRNTATRMTFGASCRLT